MYSQPGPQGHVAASGMHGGEQLSSHGGAPASGPNAISLRGPTTGVMGVTPPSTGSGPSPSSGSLSMGGSQPPGGVKPLPADLWLQKAPNAPTSGIAEHSGTLQQQWQQDGNSGGGGGGSSQGGGGEGGLPHSNVYVRNIPEEVTEPQLEALFRVYGDVTSCRLVRGTKSTPRGYGFVRFAS